MPHVRFDWALMPAAWKFPAPRADSAMYGHPALVGNLLRMGCDPNDTGGCWPCSAAACSIVGGRSMCECSGGTACLNVCMARRAAIDGRHPCRPLPADKYGQSALRGTESAEVAELLIQAGADASAAPDMAENVRLLQAWRRTQGSTAAGSATAGTRPPLAEQQPDKRCAACGAARAADGAPLKKCARCKRALFCSASCQKTAWPIHRLECF